MMFFKRLLALIFCVFICLLVATAITPVLIYLFTGKDGIEVLFDCVPNILRWAR